MLSLAAGGQPALQIVAEPADPTRIEVRASLPRDFGANGGRAEPADAQLTLHLLDAQGQPGPPILADLRQDGHTLTLRPRYPLAPGCCYRACLSLAAGAAAGALPAARLERHYQVPLVEVADPPPLVERVYPSSHRLPANLLKFYIHFSQPMSPGRALFERIELRDDRDQPTGGPWWQTELWNHDYTRLTLWVHPGRVKQGVNLRDELGPVLEPGRCYSLVVTTQMRDRHGRPLARSFVKRFTATAELNRAIEVDRWQVVCPAAGSRDPLGVAFDRPLDRHLAARALRVVDAAGNTVAGEATLDDEERRWSFRPHRPWSGGRHTIEIDGVLEDVCGNSPGHPFDADLSAGQSARARTETFRVSFTPSGWPHAKTSRDAAGAGR